MRLQLKNSHIRNHAHNLYKPLFPIKIHSLIQLGLPFNSPPHNLIGQSSNAPLRIELEF